MARVLNREWQLGIDAQEQAFPLPAGFFETNPMGQVPVLELDGERLFPTFLILERMWEMAGRPASAYDPRRDRQILLTVLSMCDALADAYYQKWSGLGPVGPNAIGYDPAVRNLERVATTLAWLERLAVEGKLSTGLTLPGVALAATVLWADAREGLEWRQHARLSAMVETLEQRPGFAATVPIAWSPD